MVFVGMGIIIVLAAVVLMLSDIRDAVRVSGDAQNRVADALEQANKNANVLDEG